MQFSHIVPWQRRPRTLTPRAHGGLGRLDAALPFERLFDEFFRGIDSEPSAARAPLAVRELDDELVVTVELAGVDPEAIDLEIHDDRLVLRAEKRDEKQEDEGGWHVEERTYGLFERVVGLPCEVDEERVTATSKNGVLTVRLPKATEARERVRKISVDSGD